MTSAAELAGLAPVGHPGVRGEGLRALGEALADIHGFYGRPA